MSVYILDNIVECLRGCLGPLYNSFPQAYLVVYGSFLGYPLRFSPQVYNRQDVPRQQWTMQASLRAKGERKQLFVSFL